MQRENKEFNASGDIAKLFPLHHNLPCLAKLGTRRHIILKERLMAAAGTAACATSHPARNRAEIRWRMAYSEGIRPPAGPPSRCFVHDIVFDGAAHRTRFARPFPRPQ